MQAGISVKFQNNRATITPNNFIVAIAGQCGNLFQLKIKIKKQIPNENISKFQNSNLCHKQLGHISNKSMMKLVSKNPLNIVIVFCLSN